MILNRRHPRTRLQKVREIIWPSMGLSRTYLYYKQRIGRLSGSPYFIASGFATGVAISFTPFVGFHIATAAVISWMLGGSLVAMVLGSVVSGNPWTYPFIWVSTYKLGQWMLGGHIIKEPRTFNTQFTFSDLLDKSSELLLPMTLGSVPFAIVSWVAAYFAVKHIVTRSKEARQKRIHKN